MTDIILYSPDPSRSSRPHSLTASPTVELLERKAERLSLGAVQTDLQTEIKKIWDEEKKRDEIRDTLRDSLRASLHGSPFTSPTPANENGSSGVWGMGEEIRKIWADETRRSQMSSPVMRYSPIVSPALERQTTHRSTSSKGSIVESLRSQENGFGGMLTRTTTGNRSVTSPLVPREATTPIRHSLESVEETELRNDALRSPPSTNGGLFITNPSESPQEDHEEDDFSRRNPNRNTITMPKRIDIQGVETASRSTSTASKNTLQRAGSIFKDFDGAYRSASLTSNDSSVTSDFVDELERGLGLSSPLVSKQPPPAEPRESRTQFDRSETGYSDSIPPRHSDSPRLSQVKQAPEDGMVYYPAPVPRVLNLPKKLSKRPAANSQQQQQQDQTQRQSLFFDVRKSAMYGYGPPHAQSHANRIGTPESMSGRASVAGSDRASNNSSPERNSTTGRLSPPKNHRQSMMTTNRKALPAHLRASVFFEGGLPGHNSVLHEVEVKAQSAVLTLENMLDKSARAPIAGRRSPRGIRTGNSSQTGTRNSSPDKSQQKSKVNYLPLGKWNGDKTAESITPDPAPIDDIAGPHSRNDTTLAPWASNVLTSFDHFSIIEEDETESPLMPSSTSPPQLTPSPQPAPHTLLAELATRKAAQKSRNRTAADAFPHGTMNATLLELDAVSQLEAENRVKRRTVLAWEKEDVAGLAKVGSDGQDGDCAGDDVGGGDAAKDDNDEDTPLALLPVPPPKSPKRKLINFRTGFPTSGGGANGASTTETLLTRQAREESEPLSIRKSRLFGTSSKLLNNTKVNTNTNTRAVSAAPSLAGIQLSSDKENENDADTDNETLAQRTKRLKELKQLSNYLANGKSSLKRGNTVRAVSAYTQGSAGEGMDDLAEEDEDKGGFADEVLRDAGVVDDSVAQSGNAREEEEEEEVEESLGQRRARLQAEGAESGRRPNSSMFAQPTIRPIQPSFQQQQQQPSFLAQQPQQQQAIYTQQHQQYQQQQQPLYTTQSYLSQGQYQNQGGLLAQSEHEQATRRKQLWLHNSRAVSHGAGLGVWADMVGGLNGAGSRPGQGGQTESWVARGV